MSKIAVLAPLFFLCLNVQAASQTEFEVVSDEFGSGKTHRLTIFTDDTSLGGLFISCHSGEKLQAQLNVRDTIFPNNTRNGYMWLNVTYKGEGENEAANSEWRMNMMKYDNAWLLNGVDRLIEHMQTGNQLSLRLDKAGTIYRFPTVEAQKHLGKILSACS